MKSPQSLRPSGDRRIARLFMAALRAAGYGIELASEFRSWQGNGNQTEIERLEKLGRKEADCLITHYRSLPESARPCGWFTYHLYHKAPDFIGPAVCQALDIPYFLGEASVAQKQQNGPWSAGFDQSVAAIKQAARIFSLNPVDNQGLLSVTAEEKLCTIPPFLDQVFPQPGDRQGLRQSLGSALRISGDAYWLVAVAMMRQDAKLQSYQQLARTIDCLERKDWHLLIVGDGTAELIVRDYFRFDTDRRVHFLGRRDQAFIQQLMIAADLFVWPAINEAIGMVALEALSCGLPAVCGHSGGINQIIKNDETGVLIDDPESQDAPNRFVLAIEQLLASPETLVEMSEASIQRFHREHTLHSVANKLRSEIDPFVNRLDSPAEPLIKTGRSPTITTAE